MSSSVRTQRQQHTSPQRPPAWLFSNNFANKPTGDLSTSIPPTDATPITMAKKSQKTTKPKAAKPTASSASKSTATSATPPTQLMNLVETFLSDQGFDNAHREFQKHRAKKGWKESASAKQKDKEHHSLVSVFHAWKTFASQGNTPVLVKEDPMEKITKVSSSSEESDSSDDSSSESESDNDAVQDIAMADAPAADESSSDSSESSSSDGNDSDSGSDSDSDEEETVPVKSTTRTAKAGANPLKRKAESDSESSDSDSDQDMSDEGSEDERPQTKKAKTSESSDESESESKSESESDSDDESSDDDDEDGDKAKPSVTSKSQSVDNDSSSSGSDSDSDSSESDSDSDSDAEPQVDVKAAAKIPLPESDSSSDSESELDDEKSPQVVKDKLLNGTGSDTSATLDKTSPEFTPSTANPPLPPDPSTLKANNRGKNGANASKLQNQPFSRIRKDVVVDPRLSSNAYVSHEYGEKAHQDLIITKGRGFTKEKNKKKRGSYKGGPLDIHQSRSIKFDD
ncbi:SRP40, C-terminal domain-containing protein [Hypoxylon fuscum]|nr:SRP40, C-terminal domain-containing protein [Hypoxylon fuscum]